MFRKSYIVYPKHTKEYATPEQFIAENGYTTILEAIKDAFEYIGHSPSDKSRLDMVLVNENYFLKVTLGFNMQVEHEAWDNKYIELVGINEYYPFFEETDAHIF